MSRPGKEGWAVSSNLPLGYLRGVELRVTPVKRDFSPSIDRDSGFRVILIKESSLSLSFSRAPFLPFLDELDSRMFRGGGGGGTGSRDIRVKFGENRRPSRKICRRIFWGEDTSD